MSSPASGRRGRAAAAILPAGAMLAGYGGDEPAPAAPAHPGERRLRVRAVHGVAALATVAVLAAMVALLTMGDGTEPGTPEPSPVPSVEDPAGQAREIADWIERRTTRR
jgi:hypothetical protein